MEGACTSSLIASSIAFFEDKWHSFYDYNKNRDNKKLKFIFITAGLLNLESNNHFIVPKTQDTAIVSLQCAFFTFWKFVEQVVEQILVFFVGFLLPS